MHAHIHTDVDICIVQCNTHIMLLYIICGCANFWFYHTIAVFMSNAIPSALRALLSEKRCGRWRPTLLILASSNSIGLSICPNLATHIHQHHGVDYNITRLYNILQVYKISYIVSWFYTRVFQIKYVLVRSWWSKNRFLRHHKKLSLCIIGNIYITWSHGE